MTLTPHLKKTLWIWFAVIACLHVINRLTGVLPSLQTLFVLLNAALLMYTPLLVGSRDGQKLVYLDWRWQHLRRDVFLFFVVSVVVFVPFAVGNHFYQGLIFGRTFHSLQWAGLGLYFFNQVILVALPEEIFFRGFLEEALTRAYPPVRKFLGAPFGKAVLLNGVIFAFSHTLITFQWWHFSIFFPSLLFSWLRQKTGTIWVAAVFHAACNCVAWLIAKSYS